MLKPMRKLRCLEDLKETQAIDTAEVAKLTLQSLQVR